MTTIDFYKKVSELIVDEDPSSTLLVRSRFVEPKTHARLVAACQVDLARKISAAKDTQSLLSVLATVPDRWIWERTDSVMWLIPLDVMTNALSSWSLKDDEKLKILSVLESFLVDCLADNSFYGWNVLCDIALSSQNEAIILSCLRVLRRHPMFNNPRKFSRQSPIVGSGTSNPLSVSLFVVDVSPSSKSWIEKAGGKNAPISSEEFSKTVLRKILSNTENIDLKTNGSDTMKKAACFLQALEMTILLVPRSMKQYMDRNPNLVRDISNWFKPEKLMSLLEDDDSRSSFLISLCECTTAILRETTFDETMAKLLGLNGNPSDVGFSSTIKKILTGTFLPNNNRIPNSQYLFALLGIYGARCQPIGGWTPQAVVTAFSPWLGYAIQLLDSEVSSPLAPNQLSHLHFAIVLTRLIGTVVDIGSPTFGAFFRDNRGFQITAKRLADEVDILVKRNENFFSNFESLTTYGEWHARTVLVRGLMRLSELAFHALEGAGGGGFGGATNTHVNLHQSMGLIEGYFPSMKKIFENPDSCSSGTVAITCSVLAQLIGHEPTSIVQLVNRKILESLVMATVANPNVRASGECLSSITATFTAVCVHSDGEKELERLGDPLNNLIIPTFGNVDLASVWLVPMKTLVMDKSDYSVGALVGTSCDELIRNRPIWRKRIVDSMIATLIGMKNVVAVSPDMLVSISKLIQYINVNLETATLFVESGGLISLMEVCQDDENSLPINFTQCVPSHPIFRVFKQLTQQCFQIHSSSVGSAAAAAAAAAKNHVLFSWPTANVAIAKNCIGRLQEGASDLEILKTFSPLHLALHTAAVALKDTSPITSPRLVESLNPFLRLLLDPTPNSGQNIFQLVCRLACDYAIKDPKARADEEKELRRRLRDDRSCAESVWDITGNKSDDEKMTEYVRGLWMVVRGFMCQMARVINYPNMSRQQSRRITQGAFGNGQLPVSIAARVAAVHLSILAKNCLEMALVPDASPITANEAVDLLCRLHVEDKQHMTRTVCLDTFFKLGGVDLLLELLDKACANVTEYGESLQGILWWFERTTSLKRMHNAQITHLLEKSAPSTISDHPTDDMYSFSEGSLANERLMKFDAVKLVSSLQGEFAKKFLPHWRSDKCVLGISAKASASLLKALTHVLEPNERVLTEIPAPPTQSVAPGTSASPSAPPEIASPPPTRLESQSPMIDQRSSSLIASLLRRGIAGNIWRPTPGELSTNAPSREETASSLGGNLSTTDNASPEEDMFGRSGSASNMLSALMRSFGGLGGPHSSALLMGNTPQSFPDDLAIVDAVFGGDSHPVKIRQYCPFEEIVKHAKDVASDFMVRTIVLGSSEHTSATPAQTHIADVCVRISHNKILKLGSSEDEETIKLIQGLAVLGGEEGDIVSARDRAGTTVVEDELMVDEDTSVPTQARIDANLRISSNPNDLASVETDAVGQPLEPDNDDNDNGVTIRPQVDFSLFNTRYIANTCVEKFEVPEQRRIASTILACILHARFDTVKDLLESFPLRVVTLIKTIGVFSGAKIPTWIMSSLVCVDKSLRKQSVPSSPEFVKDIVSSVCLILDNVTEIDSAVAESILRVVVSGLASLNDPLIEREIVEESQLIRRVIQLPQSAAFEGIQSLVANLLQVYMRGRVLDVFSLWEIEQAMVTELERRGDKGMKLFQLMDAAENVSEEYLNTRDCKRTVLMRVLEGLVAFKVANPLESTTAERHIDDPVKRRRKTGGYEPLLGSSISETTPLENRVTVTLLPPSRRTRALRQRPDTLPEFFVKNLTMLAESFVAGMRHDDSTPSPRALSPEDFLYLIEEYCRESEGRFFDRKNVKEIFSIVQVIHHDGSLSSLLTFLITNCFDLFVRSIENASTAKSALKIVNQFVSVCKKNSTENQLLMEIVKLTKQQHTTTLSTGQLVMIHRVLTIGGTLKTDNIEDEISWIRKVFMSQLSVSLDTASADIIEGLVDCVEIATRPPIGESSSTGRNIRRARTPTPEPEMDEEDEITNFHQEEEGIIMDENGSLITTDGVGGANIVSVQVVAAGDHNAMVENLRGRALSMEGESILGGGPSSGEPVLESSPVVDDTRTSSRPPRLAPITDEETGGTVGEPPIRRMLSPFVQSDWSTQLPNWYNNRRSGGTNGTSGIGVVTADDFLTGPPTQSSSSQSSEESTITTTVVAFFGIPNVGWSFDPSHTAEHPLISRSHTGSSNSSSLQNSAAPGGAAAAASASPLLGPSFAAPGQPPPPLSGPRDASDEEIMEWFARSLISTEESELNPIEQQMHLAFHQENDDEDVYDDFDEEEGEEEDEDDDDDDDDDGDDDMDEIEAAAATAEMFREVHLNGGDGNMIFGSSMNPLVSDVLMGSPALPEMVPVTATTAAEEAVVEGTGIAGIEQAARRFNMSEQDFISLTGLDPSVIRDLPEDMHAEIIREFISGLSGEIRGQLINAEWESGEPPGADNATFLATITQPEIRNEILLSANEEFLASLPPDLHAEAVMLRERLSRRTRRQTQQQPPPRRPPPIDPSVQQSMNTAIRSITDLFQRALEGEDGNSGGAQVSVQPMGSNMATVNVLAPTDSVGVNELLNILGAAAGGNGNQSLRFGRLLNRYRENENPRAVTAVNHTLPRLSTMTVNKVCEFYDSQNEPPTILPFTDIDVILKIFSRIDITNTTRVVAENLVFNLALSGPLRDRIVKKIVHILLADDTHVIGRNRIVNLMHFLVQQIPFVMECIARDVDLTNNLIQSILLKSTNSQPVSWDLLHHLLVPLNEDRPSTTRHRHSGHADSVVDKLVSNLSNESVRLIIASVRNGGGDETIPHSIISSLSTSSESHRILVFEEISYALIVLGRHLTDQLRSSQLVVTDISTDEERLCDLIKIRKKCLKSLLPQSTFDSPLAELWTALDTELSQYDSIHASEEPASALPSPSGTGGGSMAALNESSNSLRPTMGVHHGVKRLFYLIEAFVVEHTTTMSELNHVVTGGLARSLSQAAGLTEDSQSSILKNFADKHRRPLNGLIRESPELLFSTFSPIVLECPWVLDFDNKRKYFRKKLKSLSSDQSSMIGSNPIRLSVRRSEVFMDSFYQLRHRTAEEMRGKLSVQFTAEEGVDAGGLVREWFGILAREIFNPNYALFRTAGGKASTFHPNPNSFVNPEHLSFFEFCGRIMGKALFDDQRLDAYFTRSFYKHMLGSPVTWMDFEVEDPDYYKQLMWILDNDLTSPEAASVVEHLTFTTDVDEFGRITTVELVSGGTTLPVTEENKKEFVRLVCEYKMTTSITPQVKAFMKGFHELIPAQLIGQLFDDKELELLISGLPTINLADLRSNTDYVNYNASSDQIQWFWKVLENDFTQEQLAWFLQFVTGSAQVPLEGFKALVGMRGPQKFSIHKAYGSERLPTAHTCFNQLDLPEYTSEEVLREKLLKAVTEAHEGFGFI